MIKSFSKDYTAFITRHMASYSDSLAEPPSSLNQKENLSSYELRFSGDYEKEKF